MQRIARFALEPIAIEQSVGLHVPDHRLDHPAALEQSFKRRCQAPRVAQCVLRTIVTGRSGIVTAENGIVTGRSGNVTERTEEAVTGCV
jgi:hypothetical protein